MEVISLQNKAPSGGRSFRRAIGQSGIYLWPESTTGIARYHALNHGLRSRAREDLGKYHS
jgi:hypothetical protein